MICQLCKRVINPDTAEWCKRHGTICFTCWSPAYDACQVCADSMWDEETKYEPWRASERRVK